MFLIFCFRAGFAIFVSIYGCKVIYDDYSCSEDGTTYLNIAAFYCNWMLNLLIEYVML